MPMEVLTRHNENINKFFEALDRITRQAKEMAKNTRMPLNGEYLLTDKEVSEKLKISRRTLQDYRDQGKIAYIHLGGKILYKETDIQKMLDDHYYKAWKQ